MIRKVIVILLLFVLLSAYVATAIQISLEDFEDDPLNGKPSEPWYNYTDEVNPLVGDGWNANISNQYAFASIQSFMISNAVCSFIVNNTNYTYFTFYYLTNKTTASGGWFQLYNGSNWSSSPCVIFIHFDTDFRYENGLGPPIGLGMPICVDVWYKIDLFLNWSTKECLFSVYNTTSSATVTNGWDRMYLTTQDSISMYIIRDAGTKDWFWIDDITFPLYANNASINITTTIQSYGYFILALAIGLFSLVVFVLLMSSRKK
jgi:hypothetical protein